MTLILEFLALFGIWIPEENYIDVKNIVSKESKKSQSTDDIVDNSVISILNAKLNENPIEKPKSNNSILNFQNNDNSNFNSLPNYQYHFNSNTYEEYQRNRQEKEEKLQEIIKRQEEEQLLELLAKKKEEEENQEKALKKNLPNYDHILKIYKKTFRDIRTNNHYTDHEIKHIFYKYIAKDELIGFLHFLLGNVNENEKTIINAYIQKL